MKTATLLFVFALGLTAQGLSSAPIKATESSSQPPRILDLPEDQRDSELFRRLLELKYPDWARDYGSVDIHLDAAGKTLPGDKGDIIHQTLVLEAQQLQKQLGLEHDMVFHFVLNQTLYEAPTTTTKRSRGLSRVVRRVFGLPTEKTTEVDGGCKPNPEVEVNKMTFGAVDEVWVYGQRRCIIFAAN